MCSAQWRGGSGDMSPRNFLSFTRSEINSGAFWDTFPWQGTRTNLYLSDHIIITGTSIRFDTAHG